MRIIVLFLCCLAWTAKGRAQACTNPGQTPASAFPVCASSTFQQSTVPLCGSRPILVPGCNTSPTVAYTDKNPYWYRITCYQSGTLGFLIKPNNASDDYDWQLYDITGRNPDDVFTNISLVVTGNWSGTLGNTGASASGVAFIQCASAPSDNLNPFAAMPQLIAGHTYLLLVSHYTDSQSGYGLSFGGGTAVITDPTLPGLQAAEGGCNGSLIRVKLKKKVKCSSLAANGSDFFITPAGAAVTGATGIGCAAGFDTDSILVQLNTALAPGNYTLNIKQGTDGNTLLDNCDNAIPVTDKVDFFVLPQTPTPMDSLVPVSCAPQTLRLVFKKPILCSSVAPNGSDFIVTGSYPVTVTGASASCAAGSTVSKEIIIQLGQPLYGAGSFVLTLKTGSDGNTLLDECSKETPAGSALSFSVKDTVNAGFSFLKRYGCSQDTIRLFHPGTNGVNSWSWTLADAGTSMLQNPVGLYSVFNEKTITLIVSNGFCSDTGTQKIALTNTLTAAFSAYEDNCPNEAVAFTQSSAGIGLQHQWSFGDGATASGATVSHVYGNPSSTTDYRVKYTVTDSIGCQRLVEKTIRVYSSCYLAVPNAFTPNGDGKNDYMRVLNAIKTENLEFRIFNRWGQLVFQTADWKRGWDGTINRVPQASGTYVWFLVYTDRDTKERRQLKGTTTLIR